MPKADAMPRPAVIRTVSALRRTIRRWHGKGETVALVPTMGALHAGHLELVKRAARLADRVVVSIFVNPAQFAPNEDLASYPRTWKGDLAALVALETDAVWTPAVPEMYPKGFDTRIEPGGPARAGLEDRFRPHFFGGVTTVVAKLLLQVEPQFAMFGEKDYQQLKVVTAMARDLDIPVRIVGVPTMREKDGLAMSSRNAYLSPRERADAPALHRMLRECAREIESGRRIATVMANARRKLSRAGFAVDYIEARNAETLAPVGSLKDGPVRLLVAARLGRTRLIDNVGV
jgi:pantoate--beta-alanine ligase